MHDGKIDDLSGTDQVGSATEGPESLLGFSFQSRKKAIERFRTEIFDLLVIGGGITGAAVARDAASRGLKVALVEKRDFAFGTSSRSSKLIHGGLRYLQNFELGLVFEALSERALLLKTAPHLVRPVPFFLPVYEKDSNGRFLLNIGLWLYDLLALFRTPEFHKNLSKDRLLLEMPFLNSEGLKGGFKYYDATMWDDALVVETLRSAQELGVAAANYVEALKPVWDNARIAGFIVRDVAEEAEGGKKKSDSTENNTLRAHRTVVCVGPWTDQLGIKLSPQWERWLVPSKGIHLVFSLKRLPVPGAMVMSNPSDGRVSFVVPRPDFGEGVVIVGTTDGPTDFDPEQAEIQPEDVQYLMNLLNQYFPSLKLTTSDILSGYVGVRPLMGKETGAQSDGDKMVERAAATGGQSGKESSSILQKVSREHHISMGPGGTVVVAGGKYTTHRNMAREIVDFTLKSWRKEKDKLGLPEIPTAIGPSATKNAVSRWAGEKKIAQSRRMAEDKGTIVPKELWARYGAEAPFIVAMENGNRIEAGGPEGFPCLKAQLRHAIRFEMVVHLEDFYFRRVPLYACRKDHGWDWAELLSHVWADEMGVSDEERKVELVRLKTEIDRRSKWERTVGVGS